MRQTQLFTKTHKNIDAEEISKNASLLTKAGFVHKEMAGVYAYLPLGLRVVENIKKIVREEMNLIGGQEIIMTSLQKKETWEKTKRWDDKIVDVWFKSQLKSGTEVGFGWSHEEPITEMMKQFLHSYRDLPAIVYQFQTKLRNELRAKSGIMRGREFVMKDMYSYHIDQKAHEDFYDEVKRAYMKIFSRIGIGEQTYMTMAAGGAFTKYSHEFQTITEAGEDQIYVNREKKVAINSEIISDEILSKFNVKKDELELVTSAEVGNIFNFGTSKCDEMGLTVTGSQGAQTPIYLGSYGIGITRLMGVVAEIFSDERGLVWPKSIAPFKIHLVSLCRDADSISVADSVYDKLLGAGLEVLYDDRTDVQAGEKFADSDLLGIPDRIVISKKTIEKNILEYKERMGGNPTEETVESILNKYA